jgi:heterodisulfide reductase subunit A-like polyferredoxin/coenzyme F420-reducing hydrogenase delta subunit
VKEKITLFLCSCKGSISLPPQLAFGNEIEVFREEELCRDEGRKRVTEVKNKCVIAGCSPRIAEKFFSSSQVEFVNIREQGSFIGASEEKIKALILAGIERAKVKETVEKKIFELKQRAVLVLGAGIAGLEVARQVAQHGLKVFLVEKSPFLGGLVAKLDRLYPAGTPHSHTLAPLINEVVKEPNIEILTQTHLLELKGELGNYIARLKQSQAYIKDTLASGKKAELVCPQEVEDAGIKRKAIFYQATHPDYYAIAREECNKCGKCQEIIPELDLSFPETELTLEIGAVVVATGLIHYDISKLSHYRYGQDERVLTPLEFERKVTSGEISPQRVVIINCSGSRDENYLPYCSGICCFLGLKEAKLIKDKNPEAEVYLCYIDIRTSGELEELYTILRKRGGVNFIEGKPAEVISHPEKLTVRVEDTQLGKLLEIDTDYVVLSTGFIPDTETLKKVGLEVPENTFPEKYLSSAFSPDSNPRGVFICGGAAYPKAVKETLTEAREVASSLTTLFSHQTISTSGILPKINSDICAELECKICASTCPYGAIKAVEEKLEVNPSLCLGCGICSASCAAGANELQGETMPEIRAQIKALTQEGVCLAFLCKWSAYPAADLIGYEGRSYPDAVRIIRVPCTGRVNLSFVAEAFSLGAQSVLIAGCYPDACHYLSGNLKARRRQLLLAEMVNQLGIEKKRLQVAWVGKRETYKLIQIFKEMTEL